MKTLPARLRALTCAAALLAAGVVPAQGAVLSVTSPGDSGPGTLRQALADADGDAQLDTVRFQLSDKATLTLTSGQIRVKYPVQIEGPGAERLTLSAGNRSRILAFDATASGSSLAGLTLREGKTSGFDYGGAVMAEGAITVTDCVLRNNSAFAGGALSGRDRVTALGCVFLANQASREGGALLVQGGAGVDLRRCLFLGNSAATDGGAISARNVSLVQALDTAFSGNRATGMGGGAYLYNDNLVRVDNCTFYDNGGTSATGGAFFADASPSVVVNSLFWQNQRDALGWNGTIPSVTYSFLPGWHGIGAGNLTSSGLEPRLRNPKGPDGTAGTADDDLRLLSGSPCLNVGSNASVTETLDLGGEARIQESVVDMGAYEGAHGGSGSSGGGGCSALGTPWGLVLLALPLLFLRRR